MLEQSEEEQTKFMKKNFLKTLPIWNYADNFGKELLLLKHDINSSAKATDKLSEEVNKIPNFNTKNRPIIRPLYESNDDSDIVRHYKKCNGTYIPISNCDIEKYKPKDGIDVIKDKSLLMLETTIKRGEIVYAMDRPGKAWVDCEVMSISRRSKDPAHKDMVIFRLKTPLGNSSYRVLDVDKYSIARIQANVDTWRPSKRVIAGFTTSKMMPGIIAQEPSGENKNRYLVFMDDCSAQYFRPNQVFPIFGQSDQPWQDAKYLRNRNEQNEAHLRSYFGSYPKRQLLMIHVGDPCHLMRNGSFVPAEVIDIDCDTLRLHYKDDTEESIYRGSPRLGRRSSVVSQQLKGLKGIDNFDPSLLIYIHFYHQASKVALDEDYYRCLEGLGNTFIVKKSQNTARKSTGPRIQSDKTISVQLDEHTVEEDRDNITRIDNAKLEQSKLHKCSPDCLIVPEVKTESSVNDMIGEFRRVGDLKVPLLLGWKRDLRQVPNKTKNKIQIVYEAPCGKIFPQLFQIRAYIRMTNSKLDIDYFSFDRGIELNRNLEEFGAYHFVENLAVDKAGKPLENKNISLVNQFSEERLPEDFEYRNESFPHPMLEAKGFTFNPEFKSGCDCEDDCYQRSSCSCHRLNELFSGKNAHNKGAVESKCQYNMKRLNHQVGTGIFECNSFCKCSSKCANRVVQNGIRYRLQVRKTLGKGWGVITLDDIPTGAFICTYAAELLDDADQYGDSDMYYADLDYITVNEAQKEVFSDSDKSDEGVEVSGEDSDLVVDKRFNGKRKNGPRIQESDSSDTGANNDYESSGSSADRDVNMNVEEESTQPSRYPKRKQAKVLTVAQNKSRRRKEVSFRRIHDILGSHDYTLDARMQGNVGRFFNHGCDPNAIVQNVFIETHDLRFPSVAFFACRPIKALEEITWNYNYNMGCIEGRRIDCKCGAPNCKGRIL